MPAREGAGLAAWASVLWLLCARCIAWPAENYPEPWDLEPIYSFRLAEKFKLDYTPLIWRLRAAPGKLWFLWSSRGKVVRYWVASTTPAGQVVNPVPLELTAQHADIAPTSNGFASLISRRSTPQSNLELLLSEHDSGGHALWQTVVPCGGMDALTVIGNQPALICRDGALRVYAEGKSPAPKQTWGRHGTLLLDFGASRIALVDQATAQVLLQDLEAETVSPVHWKIAEIEEARRSNRAVDEELAQRLGAEQASRRTSLIVLDAASDGVTAALLIFPHRPAPDRVSVVTMNGEGRITGRYRCRFNRSATPVRIAIAGGCLALASSNGQVYVYRISKRG